MLLDAEVLGPVSTQSTFATAGDVFSLRQAIDWALANNVVLKSAEYGVQVARQEQNRSRSPLLPQVGFSAGVRAIDPDRALPSDRQFQATWSDRAHQTIYDERAWGTFTSSEHLARASQAQQESTRLDVIYDVSAAYIDFLRATTSIAVQRRDLTLSRDNLDMARVRQRVGQAGMEEVYRWESRIAQSRRQLVNAQAQLQAARVTLNTMLNRPAETPLLPEALEFDSSPLLSASEPFRRALSNPKELFGLMRFLVIEGLGRTPELKAVDAQVEAVERRVSAQKRSYMIPTIGVDGVFNHRFYRAGDGTLPVSIPGLSPDPFDWQVGVSAELPLFEGALKNAEIAKGHAQRGQLGAEKKNLALRVEQRIRNALYQAAASYASISITEDALNAAQGNLKIVRDKYQRGRSTILELLDAQNQSLTAQNESIVARFTFLQDLMAVERAIARFDFLVTEEDQESFIQRLSLARTAVDPSSEKDIQ